MVVWKDTGSYYSLLHLLTLILFLCMTSILEKVSWGDEKVYSVMHGWNLPLSVCECVIWTVSCFSYKLEWPCAWGSGIKNLQCLLGRFFMVSMYCYFLIFFFWLVLIWSGEIWKNVDGFHTTNITLHTRKL